MHQESNVKETSRYSYYQNVIDGVFRTQREKIFECIVNHQVPINRRQIKELTGFPINVVTGRVNVMLENFHEGNEYQYGDLVITHIASDPVTGASRVEYLDVAPVNKPIKQLKLQLRNKDY